MNKKNQTIVTGVFWLLGIVGLFYAASRTLHFVETTMPSGDKLNGYLYLFFTGGGAFLWAQIYLKHAVGATRRATSFMLAVGDLLAEMILVYADTQYVANANGLVTMGQDELKTFITATVGIVALNLVGWFIYHLNDPESRRASMAQDLADEVEETTYKQLNTPAERQVMINNLMPTYGASIIAEVTRNIHERAGYIPVQGTPFEPKNLDVQSVTIPQPVPQPVAVPKKDEPTQAKSPLGKLKSFLLPASADKKNGESVNVDAANGSSQPLVTEKPQSTPRTASASLVYMRKACSYCQNKAQGTAQELLDAGWMWKVNTDGKEIALCPSGTKEEKENFLSIPYL